jgi:hypothetical protein
MLKYTLSCLQLLQLGDSTVAVRCGLAVTRGVVPVSGKRNVDEVPALGFRRIAHIVSGC